MLIPVSFAESCFPVRRLRPPWAPGLIGRRPTHAMSTRWESASEVARFPAVRSHTRSGPFARASASAHYWRWPA